MTQVATTSSQPAYSTVFKDELWRHNGYCRTTMSVTKLANMRIGSVLQANGSYLLDAEAGSALTETLYIIADEAVYKVADGATVTIAVVYRGPVAVAAGNLHYGDAIDSASRTIVETRLKEQGFHLLKAV